MGISVKLCKKIRVMYKAGYSIKELADRYGIKEKNIEKIIEG